MGVCSIILAAGEGKRMKSGKPKVLSEVLFKPMIKWVVDACVSSNIQDICVVTGFEHKMVEDYLSSVNIDCEFVYQEERKGTAHAVMSASNFLQRHLCDDVVILGGDSPFIDDATILDSYDLHTRLNNAVTVVSSEVDNPYGYGRIIRDRNFNLVSIVEEKDANDEIKKIKEVNSGAYWFKVSKLLSVLFDISNHTAQGEYYLPDAISLLLKHNESVGAYSAKSKEIVLGANSLGELIKINEIARINKIKRLIEQGVNIPCSDGILISDDTLIANGTTILPGSILSGKNYIGKDCVIGPNTQLKDCVVEDYCNLNSIYSEGYEFKASEKIKPFSYVVL